MKLLTALALLFCAVAHGATPVPNQFLVKFNNGTTNEQHNIITAHGLTNHIYVVQTGVHIIRGTGAQFTALSHNPWVQWAEQDQLFSPDFIPNDPQWSNLWFLPKIQCPSAWNVTTGTTNVIIAILDSGVDATHPELSSQLVPGYNFYDGNTNTTDIFGHGTEVAGIAIALGNNGIGVASVAWGCKVMPIRISDPAGFASSSAIAQALPWAADNGVRIANLSFGNVTKQASINTAAQYFTSVGGGTVVVAAGNDGLFDPTPENPNFFMISATDQNDVIASFSSTGNNIDLSAPGVSLLTTKTNNNYAYFGGTSASAPVVAGVAGLILSVNPTLTGAQVQNILKQNSDDKGAPGWDSTYGWGRVNAYRAVSAALGTNALVCLPIP